MTRKQIRTLLLIFTPVISVAIARALPELSVILLVAWFVGLTYLAIRRKGGMV